MEIVLIVLIVIALWYFGGVINRGAETMSTLADTRLEDLEAEQILVSAKRRDKIAKKAAKMADKGVAVYSNKEIAEMLKGK